MLFGAEACDIKNKIVRWVRLLWKVRVEHCGSREKSVPTGNQQPRAPQTMGSESIRIHGFSV